MSKEPKYVTEEYFSEWTANLYETLTQQVTDAVAASAESQQQLENRIVILEALTRGMRLPDELDIAGQTYVKKNSS
jgi:hypothetical protein